MNRFVNRDEAKRIELFKYAFREAVVLQIYLRDFYHNQCELMAEDNREEAARQQMISAKVYKEMSHWRDVCL